MGQVTKGLVQTYTSTEDIQLMLTSVPWFPLLCYQNNKWRDDYYSQNQ